LTGAPSHQKRASAPPSCPKNTERFFKTLVTRLPSIRLWSTVGSVPKKPLLVDRVKPYLDRLNARETTLRQVAAELSVHPTYLGGIVRPLLQRSESTTEYRRNRSNLKESRSKYREFLANRVKLGEISVETAAIHANCSIRTIYRYLNKILAREGEKV
jgi:hypothetical protein